MFSNKDNVNQVTSLLWQYNIRHVVTCPGSRNAPLVHNFQAAGYTCHPVSDERSAGFYALGMALAKDEAVAVCVTSGTAVSNLLPAVTEAFFQHVPLVVVSADRPEAWINQLDGQTINQPAALSSVAKRVVTLPEPHDDQSRWYCNRLINEALTDLFRGAPGPVHINIPISEPLYEFSCEELPRVRRIEMEQPLATGGDSSLLDRLAMARRPLIVVGQTRWDYTMPRVAARLRERGYVVLRECLANAPEALCHVDEMLCVMEQEGIVAVPDMVVYAGGTIVSKRLKAWLRQMKGVETVRVSDSPYMEDMTMHTTAWAMFDPRIFLWEARPSAAETQWRALWQTAYDKVVARSTAFASSSPAFNAVKAVIKESERYPYELHFSSANSLALRYMNILCTDYVSCNRGTNGIEGSLSTAAGMALWHDRVLHITGDLSFFYDQNALWQQELGGSLRILLLNNGGGAIFAKFDGLRGSAARERLVMAEHSTTAEGICRQNGVDHRHADSFQSLTDAAQWLLEPNSECCRLLEVASEKEKDMLTLSNYYAFVGGNNNKN